MTFRESSPEESDTRPSPDVAENTTTGVGPPTHPAPESGGPGPAPGPVAAPFAPVPDEASRSTTRQDLLAGLGVAGVLALVGLPVGVVWSLVTPRVELVRSPYGLSLAQENPEQYMAADGVFALMGFGLGIVAAVAAWLLLRRRRGTLVLTGLVVGSLACQTVAWRFGRIGRDEYQASLDSLEVGWRTWRAPELLMTDFDPWTAAQAVGAGDLSLALSHLALGVLATMAFTAAFTYTMLAGWSKSTSLRPSR